MRTYSVWLKDASKMVEVQADDVELVCPDETGAAVAHWDFFIVDDDDNTTVAAFPFASVNYFVSSESSPQ